MDRSRVREALQSLETKRPSTASDLRLWFAHVQDLVRLLVSRGSAIDEELGRCSQSVTKASVEGAEGARGLTSLGKQLAAAAREVSALEDAAKLASEPSDSSDSKKEPRKVSLRDEILKVATHPGVITALVTAIFGSLAVALATNWVTRALGERELQLQVVEALIEYTKEPDLAAVPAISKLDALTRLIGDNQQFRVKVAGFQELVKQFREDELRRARDGLKELETEKSDLERKRRALERVGSDRLEEVEQLERDIASKQSEIERARLRQEDAAVRLAELTQSQDMTRGALQKAETELARIRPQLEAERARALRAETKLKTVLQGHVVRLEVTTEDPSDGFLSIQFADSIDGLDGEAEVGSAEFAIPSSRGLRIQERFVANLTFLEKHQFFILNESDNGWAGTVVMLVDGTKQLSVTVSKEDELESGSRGTVLPYLLSADEPVLLSSF